MSDELKQADESNEALETDQPQAENMEAGDEFVDDVAESVISETEATSPEGEVAEGDGEEIIEEEPEEEQEKDEIDIQIDLLNDPDWVVQREAVITLGEMGDERCIEPLVRCLRSDEWRIRDAAVEALANIGSPAVEMVIRYLRDWDARKDAIKTLGKINDERVLDPLISMLRIDEFKDDATNALAELGQPAVERLTECLNDKEEFVRKQAILALGRIKDPAAVDSLIEKLKDEDWYTRIIAAAGLEQIGDPRGRDALKPLLKDPDLVVRMRIERILAKWKKQPANA